MRPSLILAAATLLTTGCVGKLVVGTLDEEGLVMRLEISSRSAALGETVCAKATVTNAGRSAVRHAEGCTGDFYVAVLNPDGSEFEDGLPDPLCPSVCCASLEPRECLQSSATFDGKIHTWEPSGEAFRYAPAGNYTIVARFSATANGAPVSIEKRAKFRWGEP